MTIVILLAVLLAIWLFLWAITDSTPTPRRRRRRVVHDVTFVSVPSSGWYHLPTASSDAEDHPAPDPGPLVAEAHDSCNGASRETFHVEADDTQTGYSGGWCKSDDDSSSASSGGWWSGGSDDSSSSSSGSWCSDDD